MATDTINKFTTNNPLVSWILSIFFGSTGVQGFFVNYKPSTPTKTVIAQHCICLFLFLSLIANVSLAVVQMQNYTDHTVHTASWVVRINHAVWTFISICFAIGIYVHYSKEWNSTPLWMLCGSSSEKFNVDAEHFELRAVSKNNFAWVQECS